MALISKNMHYVYNKEYFDDIMLEKEENKKAKKKAAADCIYNFCFPDSVLNLHEKIQEVANFKFSLYTIYPGLFLGLGYPHASGESDSIVGGFSFDYITGLPTIPGSTVKGMLRSYIDGCDETKNKEREKMLCELLEIDTLDMEKFVQAIFEGENIFLGAYPVIKKGETVFASEYITPHKSSLKNPIPLSMLKVRAGIEYKFMFVLHDYDIGQSEKISKEKIGHLFEKLILLGGIGAKTNVGFGQFSIDTEKEKRNIQKATITGFDEKKNKAFFVLQNKQKGNLFFKNVRAEYGKIDKMFKIGDKVDVYSKSDGEYTNWYITK